MKQISTILAATLLAASAQAGIVNFNLQGTAGPGLLPGNEPGAIVGGTGGEIGAGIFYDDVANLLTINVGWGSSQGFTNLTSNVNNAHLHGPTTGVKGNDGTGDFKQIAGVPAGFGLTRSTDALTGGIITSSPLSFTALQETQLLDGKFYINIHTANNGGGEMRGFLVPVVPEPSTYAALAGLGVLGFALYRRRSATKS